MTWMFEDPLRLGLIGLLVTLIPLYVFWQKRDGLWLGVVIGCLLLTAGLIVVERLVMTEREEVQLFVAELAAAIENGDEQAVLDMVSARASQIQKAAQHGMRLFDVQHAGFSTPEVSFNRVVDPPEAEAEFGAMIRGKPRRGPLMGEISRPYRVILMLRRDTPDGPWKVFDFELRNPVTGHPEGRPF